MKNKTANQLTFLSLTLVVLMTIFVAKDRFNFLAYTSRPAISNMQEAQITGMILDDGKQQAELVSLNNQWFIKKNDTLQKADQQRITTLAETIASLKKEDIVSINKEKHTEFGINKQKITVTTPGKSTTIYIGNNASLSRNYLRIDDEDEVFMAEGFNDVFTPLDYRDLSIGLVSDETMVNSISVDHPDASLKISLVDNDWFLNGKKVPQERVSFFLNDLKTLKAEDILKKDLSSADPNLTIQVVEKGQIKNAQFFGLNDDYYLKISGNDTVFKVKAAYVESLKKVQSDFLN